MNVPVHSKAFKSGNSVAMPMPELLGIVPGEEFAFIRRGDSLVGRRIPTHAEEGRRLLRFREALAALKALPKPNHVETREPIEFPDRPGL